MKIAIHCCHRSGSKRLQNNFQSYLKATGIPIIWPGRVDSIGEPFIFTDQEYVTLKTNRTFNIVDNNIEYITNSNYTSIYDEKTSRIHKLAQTNLGFVLKHKPWKRNEPFLIKKICNKEVAVIRNNLLDQVLSFCLAKHTDVWDVGTELNKLKMQQRRISIDADMFIKTHELFSTFNAIQWPEYVQVVKFEEMVKINSSLEFCEFFNLEPMPFNFEPFLIEYGTDKFNLVSNLDDILKIFSDLNLK